MSGSLVNVSPPKRIGTERRAAGRTLFTLASGLSLLLCFTFVSLWVRSISHEERAILNRGERGIDLQSTDGVFGLAIIEDRWATGPPPTQGWSYWRHRLFRRMHEPSIFQLQVEKTRAAPEGGWQYGNRRFITVSSPYWFPVLVTALLPARWLWVRRRTRPQFQDGFCASCGYNLTGNVSGVCPECGRTPGEARARRNQRARRTALAAATVPVLLLVASIGLTAVDQYRDYAAWKRRLAVQQQYLNFTAPADQVVWTEDAVVAQRLADRPDYMNVGNCVCFGPLIREEIPGFRFSFSAGPALFLHGRRTADGTERLVSVGLMALGDCEHLRAEVFVPLSGRERVPLHVGQCDLILRRWPDEPLTFRVGQPDPADPSHFTIGYTMNGQSGTIEGWLTGAKSVNLQVRDGPAQTLKTSPTPITFFGGTWGGTPAAHKAR